MIDKKIDILIVEDNHFYRKGLVLALKRITNIGKIVEASDGNEFLKLFKIINPDIILMDIKMPGMNGIEATKKACQIDSRIMVIALTMYIDENYLLDMLYAGAKGFLFKDSDEKELADAINTVISGKFYFSEKAINNMNLKVFL